jgi:hypothetical protein
MTIFLARGLKPAPLQGDEERIELLRLPFSDVYEMTRKGKPIFDDAKSAIGVLLAAGVFAGNAGRA